MKPGTDSALSFILDRIQSVFDNDYRRGDYLGILMEYFDIFGDDGIQALAGFYLYAIRNLDHEGEPSECTRAIMQTWGHDLKDRHERCMSPRSSDYLSVWQEEYNKYNHITA